MSALEKQGLQRSYKRLRPFSGSIATAAAAAGVLGIPTARVAKSLAFLVNGRPWLAVLRGDRRLDLRKMADQIGCPRRGIKAASPIDCQQLFGYSPGVLPPGGFLVPVCVLAAAEDGQAANDAGLQLTLDSMCTRLCRWLRCLGVDSEYVGAEVRRAEVPQLAAAATAQGRIFVTRDQKLSARRGTGAVFLLATDDAASQLEELATHFGIRFDEEVVLSRCSKCNAAQFELVEPRERVQGWVPEHVYSRVEEFWQCGRCRKVFWMGPRSQAAIELVGGMLSRMRTQDESPCADFFAEGV
ncbi:hypothetical protein WJX72_009327 [[Myrmecia] bisecta]|uniref:Mut7-C RNAse domain-containing protein n=1 Tax=[Myrmecia] bisecta TaxID=41462 RepID=A0AAW1R8S9_9CHLO